MTLEGDKFGTCSLTDVSGIVTCIALNLFVRTNGLRSTARGR